MQSKKEVNTESVKIYEIGINFVPTISPENIAGEFTKVKDLIEKKDGEFIADEIPKLRNLAYSMTRKIGNSNATFDTAYFGWVKFALSQEKINEIKIEMDKNEKVLRYIIINTVRENTMAPQKLFAATSKEKPTTKKSEDKKGAEAKPEMTEAEMEKAIDEIIEA